MLGLYESYLNKGDVDLVKDGVSYRVANLYLSDDENLELIRTIATSIQKAMENKPSPERKARYFANIVIPESPKRSV